MNKAICLKKENDTHFTGSGTEYQCGNAYAKFESAVVDVIDNNGDPVVVDINDSDFIFIFGNGNDIVEKKFKAGDRVYHRNLKQYGTFVGYAWESDEECDVDFEVEDGETEQKHVSVSWLDLADRIEPILAANGKPIKNDKG